MPIHKVLHFIGPVFMVAFSVKVLKLKTWQAVAITLLLGLGKEIYDVIVIRDRLTESLLDMVGNIVGTVIGVWLLSTHKLFLFH